jgi:hypothetical protein
MQSKGWITLFQGWLKDNQSRLAHENIRVEASAITPYVPSSIHVAFFADRHEATVQLWEDGQSDFHFLDWEAAGRDPNVGVMVTHYDLVAPAELYAALDQLVNRMSPILA